MKVLVTGATGFLGKYVVQELEQLQFSIDTIGRNESSTIVANLSTFNTKITTSYDAVIHIAGKAHVVPKTDTEKKEFYDVNLQGTKNLLESLVIPPKYFVFISTVSVYGLNEGENIKEDAPLKATEPYGKSKILAEESIIEWGRAHEVKTTILRLPLLYGIQPPGNLEAMIKGIKKGYYFNLGSGDYRKSMVLAEDVAQFIPKIMLKGGIYNLTDGYHPSFKEISCKIAEHYQVSIPKSLNYNLGLVMANIGEFIQNVFKIKIPINKRQFTKMTTSLTFSDDKARCLGWQPKQILDSLDKWL